MTFTDDHGAVQTETGGDHRRMMRGRAVASRWLALRRRWRRRPQKHSGYDDASPETRAMQDDDASNPGFLWVQQGEALWSERVGAVGRSCADCHGAASVAMRGVAARYPALRCAAWPADHA